ncbi:flavin reductase family protein [Gordonia sp. MP11Mi]|uniref:Flavin reductase like domain-containing protein n=1 Tax=Gordonia sp. MP11Mi TaxID=3022769 RepID=A0AA97CVK7_9ACTN
MNAHKASENFADASARYVDVAELSDDEIYKLLSGAVQPRPIAWISTVSERGVRNLAPFSFFTVASRKPPTVAISISERIGFPGETKDTLANILNRGEFVVNIPSVDNAAAVAASSATVTEDVDEFALAQVNAEPAQQIDVPAVADSLVSLECRLRESIPLGLDTLVLGTVVAATVRSGSIDDDMHTDPASGRWLARIAGPYFSRVTPGVNQADIGPGSLQ